jgi:hypothetical protein
MQHSLLHEEPDSAYQTLQMLDSKNFQQSLSRTETWMIPVLFHKNANTPAGPVEHPLRLFLDSAVWARIDALLVCFLYEKLSDKIHSEIVQLDQLP